MGSVGVKIQVTAACICNPAAAAVVDVVVEVKAEV
jgi:hypothetical protein